MKITNILSKLDIDNLSEFEKNMYKKMFKQLVEYIKQLYWYKKNALRR